MNLKNIFETFSKIRKMEDVDFVKKMSEPIKAKVESKPPVSDDKDTTPVSGADFIEDSFVLNIWYERVTYKKPEVEKEILKLIFFSIPETLRPFAKQIEAPNKPLESAIFTQITEEFCDLFVAGGKESVIEHFGRGLQGKIICESGRCFINDLRRISELPSETETRWLFTEMEYFFRLNSFGSSLSAAEGSVGVERGGGEGAAAGAGVGAGAG
jgi:hypothetical protein